MGRMIDADALVQELQSIKTTFGSGNGLVEGGLEIAISTVHAQPSVHSVDVSGDLVSRQYLLDEYDRQHEGPPGGARKIIEEAPAVDVVRKDLSDWIPCEKGNPEKDGFYIVTMDGDIVGQDKPFVTACSFENDKWDEGAVYAYKLPPFGDVEPYKPKVESREMIVKCNATKCKHNKQGQCGKQC